MLPPQVIPVLIVVSIGAVLLALASLMNPDRERVEARVRQLGAAPGGAGPGAARPVVARAGGPPTPSAPGRLDDLRLRLAHADYRGRHSLLILLTTQLVLAVGPWVVGAVVVGTGQASIKKCAIAVASLSGLGLVAPGMWVDSAKKARQNELRRGLPDFFDVLVLCVEGGMSLPAAWRRVTGELEYPFPLLWHELVLVQHEAEIGRPVGEAVERFARRTDLEEVSNLASVVGQSERIGSELARPLRALSDRLRLHRVQKAEEAAHKTATKIMFPTLLFIFPGVFAILLGPMIIKVMTIFSGGK